MTFFLRPKDDIETYLSPRAPDLDQLGVLPHLPEELIALLELPGLIWPHGHGDGEPWRGQQKGPPLPCCAQVTCFNCYFSPASWCNCMMPRSISRVNFPLCHAFHNQHSEPKLSAHQPQRKSGSVRHMSTIVPRFPRRSSPGLGELFQHLHTLALGIPRCPYPYPWVSRKAVHAAGLNLSDPHKTRFRQGPGVLTGPDRWHIVVLRQKCQRLQRIRGRRDE